MRYDLHHFFAFQLLAVCLGLMLFIHVPACAQTGKVMGKITFEGEAVEFGMVILTNSQGQIFQGADTDFEGKYAIDHVLPGVYVVRVKWVGETAEETITIAADEIVMLDMEIELPQGCYCAPPPIYAMDSPRNVLTQVMSDRDPNSIIAALQGGIYQSDLSETIQSRGARPYATTVYVDGVKLRGALELPFAALRSVELLQGGIPAEYGDATGGILKIETLSPIQGGMPYRNGAYGDSRIYFSGDICPFW